MNCEETRQRTAALGCEESKKKKSNTLHIHSIDRGSNQSVSPTGDRD